MILATKLKDCPNYDRVVNFLYENNDFISQILVDCYQKYLVSIKSSISRSNIDNIMNIYVDKKRFYKYVQRYFNHNLEEIYDTFDKVIMKLYRLYKNYESDKYRKISNSRWF